MTPGEWAAHFLMWLALMIILIFLALGIGLTRGQLNSIQHSCTQSQQR